MSDLAAPLAVVLLVPVPEGGRVRPPLAPGPHLLLLHVEAVAAVQQDRLGRQRALHALGVREHDEPEVGNLNVKPV